MSENGIITIHDTDQKYHDTFLVPDNQKQNFDNFDGPAKFLKDLEKNNGRINLGNRNNNSGAGDKVINIKDLKASLGL